MALPTIPAPDGLSQLLHCNCTGIYFLWAGRRIVYVGQSKTIKQRILQHIQDRTKKFDAFSFVKCSVGRLNSWEHAYIRALRPSYNQCGIARLARRMKAGGFPMPKAKVDYCPPRNVEVSKAADVVTVPAEELELTVCAAARFLDVREDSLRDWRKAGLLPDLNVARLIAFMPDMRLIEIPRHQRVA